MDAKAQFHVPYIFRSFQGFKLRDIKEFIPRAHMELHLESNKSRRRLCSVCGNELGAMKDRYFVKAKHLRVMNWTVEVCFFREKRHCETCKKVRSEWIDFLCPTSPHLTLEMAWWINRLSEITSVLQVSHLESVDKMSCYRVDKYILQRLLQGYKIPKVSHISVDEVYARGPRQLKENETREDLFLTVIIDHRTRKVIWVSPSRRKEALDAFFAVIGKEACGEIKVVTCDQHRGYAESVREHCPKAALVWDRFHLVQAFNEALNEERKIEWEKSPKENNFLSGRNRYLFLTKAHNRSRRDQKYFTEVVQSNRKVAALEMLKERFHLVFECRSETEGREFLNECYEFAKYIRAKCIEKFLWSLMDRKEFYNYFTHQITSGISEGMNRAIKGLKWQAYGYKDMHYFALKILQKCGYLNSRYALSWMYPQSE